MFITKNAKFRILKDGLGKYYPQYKFLGLWWYLGCYSPYDNQKDAQWVIDYHKNRKQKKKIVFFEE